MEVFLYKELSYKIIGLAMEVHRELGTGFLEKVYENALMLLLKENRIDAKQKESIKGSFKGETLGNYIADIIVKDLIILELKCGKKSDPIHKAQLANYL